MTSIMRSTMYLPEEILDAITDCLVQDCLGHQSIPYRAAVCTLAAVCLTNRTFYRICGHKLYSVSQRKFPHQILASGLLRKNVDIISWVLRMSAQVREGERIVDLEMPSPSQSRCAGPFGPSINIPHGCLASYTPLHFAAAVGSIDICLLLLEHGADINSKGNDLGVECHSNGHDTTFPTPLHMAICNRHDDIAMLLLDRGASINTDLGNPDGTALADAVYCRRLSLARWMLDHNYIGREQIRNHMARVNQFRIPLVMAAAAAYHAPEMLSFLISAGADPTQQGTWRDPESSSVSLESRTPAPLIKDGGGANGANSANSVNHPGSSAKSLRPHLHSSVEALCVGLIKASIAIQTKGEPETITSGSFFVSDQDFEEMYQTLLILLANGGDKQLRRKGRFHRCIRGIIANCLRSYRSDLDFARFAAAILEAVEPPEFYDHEEQEEEVEDDENDNYNDNNDNEMTGRNDSTKDLVRNSGSSSNSSNKDNDDESDNSTIIEGPQHTSGTPTLSNLLRSAFESYDFPLFHVLASYISLHHFDATTLHFLSQAPRMVLRIASQDFNRVYTLTSTLAMWSTSLSPHGYVPTSTELCFHSPNLAPVPYFCWAAAGLKRQRTARATGTASGVGVGVGIAGDLDDEPGDSTAVALEAIRYIRHNFSSHLHSVLPIYPDQDPDPNKIYEDEDGKYLRDWWDNDDDSDDELVVRDDYIPLAPTTGQSFWDALRTKKALAEASFRGWLDGESRPKAYSQASRAARFWRQLSVKDIQDMTTTSPSFRSVFPNEERQKRRRSIAEGVAAGRRMWPENIV